MSEVNLKHYGLYGIFDFLRSKESIESRTRRKASRLDYRERSGQDRRDFRFERGQLRRERRLIRSENRVEQTAAGNSSFGSIVGNLISSISKPKEQYTPVATGDYAQLDTTVRTNAAGGWIMGALIVSGIAGAIYFGNKKDNKK